MAQSESRIIALLGALLLPCAVIACRADRPHESAPTTAARASAVSAGRTAATGAPATATTRAVDSASTAVPKQQRPGVQSWRFDEVALGKAPEGLSAETGEWAVVDDQSVGSGGRVLAQLAGSDDAVYNVLLARGTALADLDVSVRVRAVSGRVDQGGGLIWRARDRQNYYIARYNPLEDNYRVYFVENGRRKTLQSKTLRVEHDAWHTLRVVMVGDQIRCYLDGDLQLEARDATFPKAGRVGLWTKADAKTHFDDWHVDPPTGPTD